MASRGSPLRFEPPIPTDSPQSIRCISFWSVRVSMFSSERKNLFSNLFSTPSRASNTWIRYLAISHAASQPCRVWSALSSQVVFNRLSMTTWKTNYLSHVFIQTKLLQLFLHIDAAKNKMADTAFDILLHQSSWAKMTVIWLLFGCSWL